MITLPNGYTCTYETMKELITRAKYSLGDDGPCSLYTGYTTSIPEEWLPIYQWVGIKMGVIVHSQLNHLSQHNMLKIWYEKTQPKHYTYTKLKRLFRALMTYIELGYLVDSKYFIGVLVDDLPFVQKFCDKKGFILHRKAGHDLSGENHHWLAIRFTTSNQHLSNIGKMVS